MGRRQRSAWHTLGRFCRPNFGTSISGATNCAASVCPPININGGSHGTAQFVVSACRARRSPRPQYPPEIARPGLVTKPGSASKSPLNGPRLEPWPGPPGVGVWCCRPRCCRLCCGVVSVGWLLSVAWLPLRGGVAPPCLCVPSLPHSGLCLFKCCIYHPKDGDIPCEQDKL